MWERRSAANDLFTKRHRDAEKTQDQFLCVLTSLCKFCRCIRGGTPLPRSTAHRRSITVKSPLHRFAAFAFATYLVATPTTAFVGRVDFAPEGDFSEAAVFRGVGGPPAPCGGVAS